MAFLLASSALAAENQVSPEAAAIRDFEARVADYMKVHKQAEAGVRPLKQRDSAAAITRYEDEVGGRIRAARAAAKQGDIFSPAIAAEFRRLIGKTMNGPAGARIRASLRSAEPVQVPVQIDEPYPSGVPLQSTPPTLLENLPKLPQGLVYRIVGRDLVLKDEPANVVVDFIPSVF